MGEHDMIKPELDPVEDRIESKVVASSWTAAGLGVLVAILNMVQDQPSLLGVLPVWAQSLLLAVLPPVLVFLAGYAKTSNRV